jgi:hypothetical protein
MSDKKKNDKTKIITVEFPQEKDDPTNKMIQKSVEEMKNRIIKELKNKQK